jgi:hypothetical protein
MEDNTFYRFRSFVDWDTDRFLSEMEDIEQNKLTFVNPALFNDPFEICGTNYPDKISSGEKLKSMLSAHGIKVIIFFEKILHKCNIDTKNILLEKPEELIPVFNLIRDAILNRKLEKCGIADVNQYIADINEFILIYISLFQANVCCLTKEINSTYYWSHYAKGHYGYAIKYSIEKKEASLYFSYPEPVQYIDYNEKQIGISTAPILIKSKDWENEREFRIFYADAQSIKKRDLYKHEVLAAIYLGLRFDENSLKGKYLLNICKNKNIPVFKMVSKNGFSLEAEEFKLL